VKAPRITLSELAIADILEQADWYERQAGPALPQRWERGVSRTLLQIIRRPRAGSPCRFRTSELGGIRRMAVSGFPKHLIFYQFRGDELVVLRIVHGARDLEGLFSD
jgi:toxin ParE1/3/4